MPCFSSSPLLLISYGHVVNGSCDQLVMPCDMLCDWLVMSCEGGEVKRWSVLLFISCLIDKAPYWFVGFLRNPTEDVS